MGTPGSPSDSAAKAPFRVFINYRRSDSGGYAGRISDALNAHANASSLQWDVFMDIDTIDPGVDFAEVIDEALKTCDIVITVIGRSWLQATDAKGRRRLEHRDDFVRLELEAALSRSIRVIPALVQGAEMPSSEDLPDDLARLARRNAIELSDARWRFDMDRLIAVLDRVEQQKAEQAAAEQAERERAEQERIEQERALATEQAAKEAAEHAERTRREEEERLAAVREAEERLAREQAQRGAAEREAAEREAAEREAAERAAAAREAAAREAAEREAAEREAAEREAAEREAAVRAAAETARRRAEEEQRAEAERKLVREQEERERAEYEAAAAAAVAWEREQAEAEPEPAPVAVEAQAMTEPDAPRPAARPGIGRVIAAFGLLLFLTAIWTPFYRFSGFDNFKYWSLGQGTLALSLAGFMGFAIGGSLLLRKLALDVATAALGFVTFGFGLSQALQNSLPLPFGNPFEPLQWGDGSGVGAWLGCLGPALVAAGGVAAATRRPDRGKEAPRITRRSTLIAAAVSVPGLALFFAAVFARIFDRRLAFSGGANYWALGNHHAVGILMLVLGCLAFAALTAGLIGGGVRPYYAAAAVGLTALGVTLRIPMSGLELHTGIALAFVASMLIVAGGWAMSATSLPQRLRAAARGGIGAGAVLLFVSIWLDASYWDFDGRHQRGIFLIALCLLCAAALAGSVGVGRAPRVSAVTVGLVALGFTLFVPLTGGWKPLAVGPALAVVGSLLLVIGPLVALRSSQLAWRPRRPTSSEAIALLGTGLLLVAIWQDAFDHVEGSPGSFWQTAEGGGFLLLVGLMCAASALGKLVTGIEALEQATRALGLVALGFALNPLLDAAFGDWQYFRVGTWLLVGGALLIVAGTTPALSRHREPRRALTPGPA